MNSLAYFENKTILITGCSSGLGNAMVRQLAAIPCNLHITARRLHLLTELQNELKSFPAKIFTHQCDSGKKEDVQKLFDSLPQDTQFDIAILNAGLSIRNTITEFSTEAAENIVNTNLLGVIYFFPHLVPKMIKRGEGVIAGVSSLADARGLPKSSVYCASKSALTTFLEAARVELLPHNIKVLIVRPGFVTTPLTDKNEFNMPFILPVEEGARRMLNGIAKEKRLVQFPFPIIAATRLLKFLPGRIFEFVAANAVKVAGVKKT